MPNIAVFTGGAVCPGMKNGRVFHMPIDQAQAALKRFDRARYQLVNAQKLDKCIAPSGCGRGISIQ